MTKWSLILTLFTGVALIGLTVSSLGCEEKWLEEEVVPVVQREVAEQLPRQLLTVQELTLSSLYIKNPDGEIVAVLGVDDSGNARLILGDETHARALLYSVDDGVGLQLNDAGGNLVASLVTNSGGNSTLTLYGANGNITLQAP